MIDTAGPITLELAKAPNIKCGRNSYYESMCLSVATKALILNIRGAGGVAAAHHTSEKQAWGGARRGAWGGGGGSQNGSPYK